MSSRAPAVGAASLAILVLGVAMANATDDVARAPAITVTATRIEQPISDVPSHVTVVTREDIRRSSAQTVDDLLRSIPGFSLFRRSSSLVAHPTTQGVSLRGIGPSGTSRTLVLLDGAPLNDPFGGWVHWSKVPLESIERIEIVRGGGSSVWGNYAMAGVINIVTVAPDAGRARAVVEGGNRGTVGVQALVSERRGHAGAVVDGRWFRTDGFHLLSAGQRGEIDVPAGSEHGVVRGRFDYDAGTGVTARLSSHLFTEERDNGTPLTGNETTVAFVRGQLAGDARDGARWRLDLFSQVQRFASTFSSQDADRAAESPALAQFDVPSTSTGGSFLWSRPFLEDHLLTAGADAMWVDGETHEDFSFVADGTGGGDFTRRRVAGGQQLLAGVWMEDSFAPSLRWSVTAALRLDYWRAWDGRRHEASLETGDVLRDDSFGSRDELVVSPKLGAVFHASERVSLRASGYRGFRAPTVNELYRPFRVRNDVTAANDGLDVEQLTGAEVGVTLEPGRRSRTSASVTAYWNRVDDPVANATIGSGPGTVDPCGFVPDGGVCRQRRNLGRSRIVGVEVEVVQPLAAGLAVGASYLWNDAEIRRAPGAGELVGKRIAQVPRHQAVAGLSYAGPRDLSASLSVRYVGEQFEDDLNTLALDDYVVVDASLSKRLSEHWEAFVRAENLLGDRFEVGRSADGLTTLGTPALVHGGLRYAIGP